MQGWSFWWHTRHFLMLSYYLLIEVWDATPEERNTLRFVCISAGLVSLSMVLLPIVTGGW